MHLCVPQGSILGLSFLFFFFCHMARSFSSNIYLVVAAWMSFHIFTRTHRFTLFHAYRSLLQFNFVGKLLGPRGNSLKRLQEDTLTKMSILGKGSMRDKEKVKPHSVLFFPPCSPCLFHPFTSSSFCLLLLFWSFWVNIFETIIIK